MGSLAQIHVADGRDPRPYVPKGVSTSAQRSGAERSERP
jgi:hypothetical protein